MKHIYLNLKRFDVPVKMGGVNRIAPLKDWASYIITNTQEELKKYDTDKVEFAMYFPETHLLEAVQRKSISVNTVLRMHFILSMDSP